MIGYHRACTFRNMIAYLAFFLALAPLCWAEEVDYQKLFEEIDPDLILDNERLLNSYLKCFYEEGPCSPHAEMIKEHAPHVLATVCSKCSDHQKSLFKYSLNKFIAGHPEDWERVRKIFDPTGTSWPAVKTFLES